MLGYNSRLDTLQASILAVKLRYLAEGNELRRAAAAKYRKLLKSESDIVLPFERPGVSHVYHLFVVQHPDRDALMGRLQGLGIQCGIHYPTPIHEIDAFRSARTVPDGAPISSRLATCLLSLPMFPELTDDAIGRVCDAVFSHSRVAVAS